MLNFICQSSESANFVASLVPSSRGILVEISLVENISLYSVGGTREQMGKSEDKTEIETK